MLEVQNHSRYEFFRINPAGAVEFIFNPYIMSSINNYIHTYIYQCGDILLLFLKFSSAVKLSHIYLGGEDNKDAVMSIPSPDKS